MDKQDFGVLVMVVSALAFGFMVRGYIKPASISQYQSALADDQKRVDKHIYDLGYYDGWEAVNKSEKQIRVDNGGHAIIDIDKMIAKEPCGKLKGKN